MAAGDTGYLQTPPDPAHLGGDRRRTPTGSASSRHDRAPRRDQGGGEETHRDARGLPGRGVGSRDLCQVRRPSREDCDNPNTPEQETIFSWNDRVGTVYAEPGVQVYEDPDPEGSPIGPYPLPAAYAGTCGVVLGGGPITAPASPVTNSAGQLDVRSGCE